MSAEEWQEIKIADRLDARREWHADPSISRNFFATWGAGPNFAIEGAESLASANAGPNSLPGDPRTVDWD